MPENFEEPLFWLLSTVPQVLAAGFAILLAVLMPHISNFSSQIRSGMEELNAFWASREIGNSRKSSLGEFLSDGNATGFLKLAKEVGESYGLPEHDDAGAYEADAKRRAAASLFDRRQQRLKETGVALAVVGVTIAWSLLWLPFTPSISMPCCAIPVIVLTLGSAFTSVFLIYRLAKKTLIEF